MRPNRAVPVLCAAVGVLIAFAAGGQPDGKPKPKSDASASASAVAATPPTDPDVTDIGGPPPKTAAPSSSVKSSPLNPAADEFPKDDVQTAPAEFDKLLADIAALRGRVSAVTTTMFASKLKVSIETDGDEARIDGLTISLDDGVVYRAPARFSAEDEKVVYEHGVAPGHHILGVEVERTDARNRAYKTWQTSKFSIVVPERKKLLARLEVSDDSDMAEDFPEDQEGEYDLRVRLEAEVDE